MKHSKMKLKTWAAALMLLPAVALAAPAQRGGEIVSFGTPPAGFEIGYRTSQGEQTIVELVPRGQTVQNWERMVTLQTFAGNAQSVSDFRRAVSDGWRSACPGGNTINLSEGQENGYPFAFWQMTCEHKPAKRQAGIYLDKSDPGRTCALCGAIRFPPLAESGGTDPMRHAVLRGMYAVRYAARVGRVQHPCSRR